MKIKISNRTEIRIARVSTIIIFLALIRTISEIFRLHYYSQSTLTYEKIKPFIVGILISSIALLIITIFSYYRKHKAIIITTVFTIITLLIIKFMFL